MNWKAVFKNAAASTIITLFVTAIVFTLLIFSGGTLFTIAEISIPFVFFGLNLLLLRALRRMSRRKTAAAIQICANLVFLAGYVVLLIKLP